MWVTAEAGATGETAPGKFRFHRSSADGALALTYAVGGTAANGADYVGLPGGVHFPAGAYAVDVPVQVVHDSELEGTETVTATIDPAASVVVSGGAATVSISDDTWTPSGSGGSGGGMGAPTVWVSSAADGQEPALPGVFRLRRSDLSAGRAVSVAISGTAANGADYVGLPGGVFFPAGVSAVDVPVNVVNDALAEGTETVSVTVLTPASGGYYPSGGSPAVVSIADDEPASGGSGGGGGTPVVWVTTEDAVAAETTYPQPADTGRVRVHRTGTLGDLQVNLQLTGTASNGMDYSWLSSTVTIPAGADYVDVTVTPTDDLMVEGPETVGVAVMTGVYAASGGASSGTVTIQDNDPSGGSGGSGGTETPSVWAVGQTNGSEPSSPGSFRFERSNGNGSLSVTYAVGGTATAGADYAALSGTVTFADGVTVVHVPVAVSDDTAVEGAETVTVSLNPSATYSSTSTPASVTIADDDEPPPAVWVTAVDDAAETPDGTPADTGAFRFHRDRASAGMHVSYTVSGTADGADFQPFPSLVTFPAGALTVDLPVVPADDQLREGDETVILTLNTPSAAAGYVLATGDRDAAVTIADDEPAPPPRIDWDATTLVADEGETVTLTVRLSAASAEPVPVDFATADGTAAAGNDYTTAAGTLTFAPGEVQKTLAVNLTEDALPESAETLTVTLSNAAQAEVGESATATVAITVSDRKPTGRRDRYDTDQGEALTVAATGDLGAGVLANDIAGDHGPMTAYLASGPAHGTLDLGAGGGFTYTPDAAFAGRDRFTYRPVQSGLTGDPTEVIILVRGADPIAAPDQYALTHDHVLDLSAGGGVTGNDWIPEGTGPQVTMGAGPSHGALTLSAAGAVHYVPAAGFVGEDSFTYTLGAGADAVQVTLTVTNADPAGEADAYHAVAGKALTVPAATGVLANDIDADQDALGAALLTPPAHGALQLAADGSFQYTPAAGFVGDDSFSYRPADGVAQGAAISVRNAAPVVLPDEYAAVANATLAVGAAEGVLANDRDPDGHALTAAVAAGPAHGTLTLAVNGAFVYVPAADFTGTDTFTYAAGDGVAQSDPVTAVIRVANAGPQSLDDTYLFRPGAAVTVGVAEGVLTNDSDPDGHALTAALEEAPGHGQLTLHADGSFTYTPAAGDTGADTFRYRAYDGAAYGDPATVTLRAVIDQPAGAADSYAAVAGAELTVGAPTASWPMIAKRAAPP